MAFTRQSTTSAPATSIDLGPKTDTNIATSMPEDSQKAPKAHSDHLHGVRLVLVTIGVTLMTFLLLLDQSILSTVSKDYRQVDEY